MTNSEQKSSKLYIYTHIILILIIMLLGTFVYKKNLKLNEVPMLDFGTHYTPRSIALKQSFTDYKDLIPLWNPYIMGGIPFYADHVTLSIDSLTGILVYILPNPVTATKLSFLFAVLVGGVFMYCSFLSLPKTNLRDSFPH